VFCTEGLVSWTVYRVARVVTSVHREWSVMSQHKRYASRHVTSSDAPGRHAMRRVRFVPFCCAVAQSSPVSHLIVSGGGVSPS
jgi:hypothetical protein